MRKLILLFIVIASLSSCDFIEKKLFNMKNNSSMNAIDTILYSMPTTIWFRDTSLDLMDIKQDVEKELIFAYKNTGTKPLVLFNVSPGCGCTIAEFSREPLAPNGMDSIIAKFDSKGKEGRYLKNIKVNCNTEQKVYNLSFKVNVLK